MKKHTILTILFAAMTALALLFAGCSDSGSEEDNENPAPAVVPNNNDNNQATEKTGNTEENNNEVKPENKEEQETEASISGWYMYTTKVDSVKQTIYIEYDSFGNALTVGDDFVKYSDNKYSQLKENLTYNILKDSTNNYTSLVKVTKDEEIYLPDWAWAKNNNSMLSGWHSYTTTENETTKTYYFRVITRTTKQGDTYPEAVAYDETGTDGYRSAAVKVIFFKNKDKMTSLSSEELPFEETPVEVFLWIIGDPAGIRPSDIGR